jgi:hypothetical protein
LPQGSHNGRAYDVTPSFSPRPSVDTGLQQEMPAMIN